MKRIPILTQIWKNQNKMKSKTTTRIILKEILVNIQQVITFLDSILQDFFQFMTWIIVSSLPSKSDSIIMFYMKIVFKSFIMDLSNKISSSSLRINYIKSLLSLNEKKVHVQQFFFLVTRDITNFLILSNQLWRTHQILRHICSQ